MVGEVAVGGVLAAEKVLEAAAGLAPGFVDGYVAVLSWGLHGDRQVIPVVSEEPAGMFLWTAWFHPQIADRCVEFVERLVGAYYEVS